MVQLRLGKNGLSPEFIENLKKIFVNAESVRIGLLKTSTRDKTQTKKWAETMISALGKNFTSTIIGYTIVLRKWRKARE